MPPECSPVCVVTKTCPPTHGRAARAKPLSLHHAEVSQGGPEGAKPARWCPGWAAAAGPIPLAPSGIRRCPSHVPPEAPPAGCATLIVAACVQAARCAYRTARAPAASCAQGPGRQSVGAMFVCVLLNICIRTHRSNRKFEFRLKTFSARTNQTKPKRIKPDSHSVGKLLSSNIRRGGC